MSVTKKIMATAMALLILLTIVGTVLILNMSIVSYKFMINTQGLELTLEKGVYHDGDKIEFSNSDHAQVDKLFDTASWADSEYFVFNGIKLGSEANTYKTSKELVNAIVKKYPKGSTNAIELSADFASKKIVFSNISYVNAGDPVDVTYNSNPLTSTLTIEKEGFVDYRNTDLRELMFANATDNGGFMVTGNVESGEGYISRISPNAEVDNNSYVWKVSEPVNKISFKNFVNACIENSVKTSDDTVAMTKDNVFKTVDDQEIISIDGLIISFKPSQA